jgi:hypothetical protein
VRLETMGDKQEQSREMSKKTENIIGDEEERREESGKE